MTSKSLSVWAASEVRLSSNVMMRRPWVRTITLKNGAVASSAGASGGRGDELGGGQGQVRPHELADERARRTLFAHLEEEVV